MNIKLLIYNTPFPLTPALSPRERENHLAVAGKVTI